MIYTKKQAQKNIDTIIELAAYLKSRAINLQDDDIYDDISTIYEVLLKLETYIETKSED